MRLIFLSPSRRDWPLSCVMITTDLPAETETAGFDLVARSRDGDRDAFAGIVARYQTLLCSLTFSICGNVHQSAQLAQETFVTAWRLLPKLDEPEKLKSWLCGIARNLAHRRAGETRSETDGEWGPVERVPTRCEDGAHPQICRSSDRHWIASPMWSAVRQSEPVSSCRRGKQPGRRRIRRVVGTRMDDKGMRDKGMGTKE